MAIKTPRITTKKAREGYLAKKWDGQLIENHMIIASDTSFGRGVIRVGDQEVQVPDRGNLLGNGATSDEANKFVGILKAFEIAREDYELSGAVPMPTLASPVGRDDIWFAEENTVQGIMVVGYMGAISEEAVVAGDPVTLRVANVDVPTGKVLGGFGKTAVADEALVLTGLTWGADSDALGENFIIMNIK